MNTAVKTQTEQQSRMVTNQTKPNQKSILILKKQLVSIKVIRDWNFHLRKMNLTCTEEKTN